MGSRSKHTNARRRDIAPVGQSIKLNKHERLAVQVRMLRRDVLQLEARLSRVIAGMRNDLLGIEIDLDAVKYALVTILGLTELQWEESRAAATAIYERRVASQCAALGLQHWFAGADPTGVEAAQRAEQHFHPERFAAPSDQEEHDHGTHVHAHADG